MLKHSWNCVWMGFVAASLFYVTLALIVSGWGWVSFAPMPCVSWFRRSSTLYLGADGSCQLTLFFWMLKDLKLEIVYNLNLSVFQLLILFIVQKWVEILCTSWDQFVSVSVCFSCHPKMMERFLEGKHGTIFCRSWKLLGTAWCKPWRRWWRQLRKKEVCSRWMNRNKINNQQTIGLKWIEHVWTLRLLIFNQNRTNNQQTGTNCTNRWLVRRRIAPTKRVISTNQVPRTRAQAGQRSSTRLCIDIARVIIGTGCVLWIPLNYHQHLYQRKALETQKEGLTTTLNIGQPWDNHSKIHIQRVNSKQSLGF